MAESRNPYAAPIADDIDDPARGLVRREPAPCYVVSLLKFYLLACSTLGLYKLYWFYAQFRAQRGNASKGNAALAAFFSIFTAHGLFRSIDLAAAAAGLPSSPRARNQTAPYIVLTLLLGVVRALSKQSLTLGVAALGVSVLAAAPLARVQGIINRSAGDPRGSQNSTFNALNIFSIAIGALLTLLALVGQAQGTR